MIYLADQCTNLIANSSDSMHSLLDKHAQKMPPGTPVGRSRLDEARSEAFSGRNYPSVVRKSWTFLSLANYVFPRVACAPDQTDSWYQPLRFWKAKKFVNSSRLNCGCLKPAAGWNFRLVCMLRKWAECSKRRCPSELLLCQFSKGK